MLSKNAKTMITSIVHHNVDITVINLLIDIVKRSPHDLKTTSVVVDIERNWDEALEYCKAAIAAQLGIPKFLEKHSEKILEMTKEHLEKESGHE